MSLLLDALRRAAASKQGSSADQYTVPRRADPGPEHEESPPDDDAGDDPELTLEPEESKAADAPYSPTAEAPPETVRRAAAGTLTGTRRGGGRRGAAAVRAVLGGIVVLGALAAIGAGGWWYYLESRQASWSDLASWQPTAEPLVDDEPISAAGEPADAQAEPATGNGDTAVAGDDVADETGVDTDEAAADGADRNESAADEEIVARVDADALQGADEGGARELQPQAERAGTGSGDDGSTESRATGGESGQTQADGEAAAGKTRTTESDARTDTKATDGSTSGDTRSAEPARQAEPLVRASSGPSELTRTLQAGYSALRAGDVDAAEHAYAHALELAPGNRDALLGAASVAQRRGDDSRAVALYRRVLRDHPDDDHARAALMGLEGAREPRRSETELKNLLRDRPDSAALHFALGNVYAAESRWSEAQSAYFEAYRAAPDNPDHAYNLAVALDHLGQRDAARDYYREALAGSDDGGAGFPIAAVRRRLEQLQ